MSGAVRFYPTTLHFFAFFALRSSSIHVVEELFLLIFCSAYFLLRKKKGCKKSEADCSAVAKKRAKK